MSFYEEIGVLLHRNFRMGKTNISATVKLVKLFDNESSHVSLTFDKKFPGFKQEETGEYVETEVSAISFPSSYLTALCCEHDEEFAEFRACCETKLNQTQWAVALMGATVKFTRELHLQGEILEGQECALERDCYITDIVDVEITDKAKSRLESAIMSKLMA